MLTQAQKDFLKEIQRVSGRHYANDVFSDAVHMMACSIWSPISNDTKNVEADYLATASKYTKDELAGITGAFAILMDALERDRKEFLGGILEELGANNAHNGQFLTPSSVARVMAGICGDIQYAPGEVIRICDPACGASVLMIEQAEELISNRKVSQRDIYIEVGDIDRRACDMSYVQLSLLGYSAKVEHMDALAMKRFSPPRYTPGFFLHGTEWRLGRNNAEKQAEETKEEHNGAKTGQLELF